MDLKVLLKNLKNKQSQIPYSTATWVIVEDASEPAPFLSVVAKRNGKCTHMFALFERQSLQKAYTHQNHRILHSTASWNSVPVAPVAAACARNVMVTGFQNFT